MIERRIAEATRERGDAKLGKIMVQLQKARFAKVVADARREHSLAKNLSVDQVPSIH
jgi:hypothetical protein